MGCPTIAAQVQGLGVNAVALWFPVPPACSAALGYSAVPIGSQTYSFRGLTVVSVLVLYFFFIFLCLSSIIVGNIFCAPHSYVQICAAAVVEDYCLVLSFGGLAVWLSSLLALSLRCCGHLTAAWF